VVESCLAFRGFSSFRTHFRPVFLAALAPAAKTATNRVRNSFIDFSVSLPPRFSELLVGLRLNWWLIEFLSGLGEDTQIVECSPRVVDEPVQLRPYDKGENDPHDADDQQSEPDYTQDAQSTCGQPRHRLLIGVLSLDFSLFLLIKA
jgi:hypothetical protein